MTRSRPAVGPLQKAPQPPGHLSQTAKQVWKRACAYLLNRQLLHSADVSALEAFCMAVAGLRRIEAEMEGVPLFDDAGKPHAGLRAAEVTSGTIAKLAAQLLLAPASRGRLPVAQQRGAKQAEGEDDWLAVLPGGKK